MTVNKCCKYIHIDMTVCHCDGTPLIFMMLFHKTCFKDIQINSDHFKVPTCLDGGWTRVLSTNMANVSSDAVQNLQM